VGREPCGGAFLTAHHTPGLARLPAPPRRQTGNNDRDRLPCAAGTPLAPVSTDVCRTQRFDLSSRERVAERFITVLFQRTYRKERKMSILRTVRQFAFLAILAGALAPAVAQAHELFPCPAGNCGDCDAGQFCWIGFSESCSSYGCEFVSVCDGDGGGEFTLCSCPPCPGAPE
jgi:hypothetical protein